MLVVTLLLPTPPAYTPAQPDQNVSTGTAYDALGRTTVTTDAVGAPTTYSYNGLDQTVAVTTPAVLTSTRTSQTGYDGTGATRWTQGPDGSVTVYQTDGLGRVVSATQAYSPSAPAGNPAANLTTQTLYDAAGRAVATIDPAGHVISTTYNLRDQVTQSIQNYVLAGQPCLQPPCNVTTSSTYDRAGDLVSSTDALSHTTFYGYDAAGERTSTTDPLGYTTAISYDVGGRAITTTDPLGRLSVTGYDDLDEALTQTTGLTTSVASATGGSTTTTTGAYTATGTTSVSSYSYGLQTDSSGPDGVDTHQQYDGLGRVITRTLGDGTGLDAVTATGYDAAGRAVTVTVGATSTLARADVTAYNADGSTSATIQNETGAGQVDPAHPDQNVATRYGYDAAGRQAWAADPLGRVTATHYNGAGQADWTARDYVPAGQGPRLPLPPVVALPATPPAFAPAHPDQNVATLYGYDALGQQTLVTQTGILSGTFDPGADAFSAATTRATRTEYDAVGHAITTTLNYQPGSTLPDAQPGQGPDAANDTNLRTVTRDDLAGNATWQRDTLGRWSGTQYDADNRPVTETVNYENGSPLTVTAGVTWTNGTDSDLIAVTHYRPDGSVDLRTDNYVPGTTFTATAPLTDVATRYGFDPQGRPTGTTQVYDPASAGTGGSGGSGGSGSGGTSGATNRTGASAYDLQGRPYQTTDALGHVTYTSYDLLSRPMTVTQNYSPTAAASADTNVTTGTRYDVLGRVADTVDPLGYVAHTAYDGLGRTVAITQNYSPTAPPSADTNVATRTAYDAAGEVTSRTDALTRTTLYAYDGLGQTLDITDPAGLITHTVSDATGVVRWSGRPSATPPAGGPYGRLTVRAVDGLGRVVSTTQNYLPGAPATASDATLATSTVYDAAGRPVQTTDVANRVTLTGYDLRDAPLSVTRHYVSGAAPTSDTNVTTLYAYDRAGNRVSITDPDSHVTTYSYDAAHEQTGATDALGRQTTFSYDALGRLKGRSDRRGAQYAVSYGYDALGRTLTISAPALSAPIAQSYNARGDRLSLSDGSGAGTSGPATTTYRPDALGRTVAVTQAGGLGVVSYGYDAAGQRTRLTYPSPDTTALSYAYNGDGQLTTVITAGATAGPSTPALASYGYDGVGRLTTLTRGNGSQTRYGYDGVDRLTDEQTVVGGLQQSRYTSVVDRLGRVTALTETTALQANGQPPVLVGQAYVPPAPQATSSGIGTLARAGRTLPQPSSWLPSAPLPPSLPGTTPLGPGPNPFSPRTPPTTNAPHSSAGTTPPPGSAGVSPVPAVPAPVPATATRGSAPHPSPATAASRRARLGPLPLRFEANRGQTAPAVRYLVRGTGYTLFLTPTDATLALIGGQTWTGHGQRSTGVPHGRRVAIRLQLVGGNPHARVEGQGQQAGRTAYLRGHGWSGAVPTYAQVRVQGVYHGIDLLYHGREGTLEYDWLLRPHADPRAIRLAIAGASGLRLDRRGALSIRTLEGALRQEPPVAYQTVHGRRVRVAVRYVLLRHGQVGLRLGRYDQRLPLTVDPVLRYSGYLGGSAADAATAAALDNRGNLYLTGYTASPDYPATNGFTTTAAGATYDAYITELSRTGAVSYSDYLGGSGSDAGWGIAVDTQGNAYVTGQTSSGDFPTTPYTVSLTTGASSGTCPGLTGLLGGALGLSLVCPVSYPVQTGPALTATATLSVTLPATGTDAFVVKVSADGGSIGYSERLGSLGGINAIGDTWGRAIAVDGQGNAYVTGQTDSPDFPVTTLSPIGITNTASLVHGVCNPLTGLNTGTLTQAITTTGGLCYDAFVTKLSPSYQGLNGRILYSTYLGGGRDDYGYGIATDGRGNAYVTGRTDSPDFPTTTGGNLDRAAGTGGLLGNATYPACHETYCPDAFAARLDTTAGGLITAPPAVWQLTGPVIAGVTGGVGGVLGLPVAGTAGTIVNGPTLTWSRFLGGSGADEGTAVALDPVGNVYVAGDTAPPTAGTTGDFSTPAASDPATATTRAYSTTTPAGACPTGPCADAFVVKLSNTSSNSQTNGQVVYASRIGGGGDDRAAALAVDTAGHAYVVGSTSSADYPLIGSLQGFAGTQTGAITTTMAFVTKLNIQGSALWYSSYLGGSGGDAGSAVAVDGIGDVALAGTTGSTDFLSLQPVARQEVATQPTQTHLTGSQGQPDAFVATIDATTRYLTYGYDNVDRLTGVTETLGNAYGYAYDPAGNRTDQYLNGVAVQHSQYDSANEAITVTTPRGATIDSYDAAGNLTADATNSYRYDPLNRLIALTPSGPTGATGQPAQPETYTYNGDGTLVAQTAGTGNSAVTTHYTQDLAIQPSLPGANGGPSTGLFAPTGHTPPPSQVLQARVTQNSGGDLVTDYAYGVDTGGNPSRFASNPLGGGAHTWSVADLQGSPRYTQDDSGQPTGAGTPAGTLNYNPQPVRYDPYGAIDLGADGNGQVPQTFGYRGELQDANTGLVNLRARTYNPATGQFLTRDPLEQQTGQAYAYAGNNPINNSDPTGQLYQTAQSADALGPDQAAVEQAIVNDFVRRDSTRNSVAHISGTYYDGGTPGQGAGHPAQADLVSLSTMVQGRQLPAGHAIGETFDLVYADTQTYVGTLGPELAGLLTRQGNLGKLFQTTGLTRAQLGGAQCPVDGQGVLRAYLVPGFTYPRSFGDYVKGGGDLSQDQRPVGPSPYVGPRGVVGLNGTFYQAYTRLLSNGFIGYYVCQFGVGTGDSACTAPDVPNPCLLGDNGLACALGALEDQVTYQTVGRVFSPDPSESAIGLADLANNPLGAAALLYVNAVYIEGARVIVSNNSTLGERLLAAVGIVPVPAGLFGRLLGTGARLAPVAKSLEGLQGLGRSILAGSRVVAQRTSAGRVVRASDDVRLAIGRVLSNLKRAVEGACAYHCFPAGTLVATPRGHVAIERLHIGDLVLAEDPATGKVEAEPVQAVIVRAKSDLMAVDLSDGSSLKVTTNHLFWVDSGPHRTHAGWVLSGDLRVGDRLRTTAGKHVLVVRVRRHVGQAVVYTLTVAQDHTFFVGTARVLVHNAGPGGCVRGLLQDDPNLVGRFYNDSPPSLNDPVASDLVRQFAQTGKGYADTADGFRANLLRTLSGPPYNYSLQQLRAIDTDLTVATGSSAAGGEVESCIFCK